MAAALVLPHGVRLRSARFRAAAEGRFTRSLSCRGQLFLSDKQEIEPYGTERLGTATNNRIVLWNGLAVELARNSVARSALSLPRMG